MGWGLLGVIARGQKRVRGSAVRHDSERQDRDRDRERHRKC